MADTLATEDPIPSDGGERADGKLADRRQLILVAGCFLMSGFAALLYETVWLRQFSIHFGTSEQALAIVLGTYMGGLALGSLLASRYAGRLRKPLLTYGLLELGIAVTALLVPVSLGLVRYLQVLLFGGADAPPAAGEFSQVLFSFAGAFAATILPTTMMGATLPMLAKHVVRRDDHLGKRIGALYAINTLGAVLGTLSAAFVCLPNLGLLRTVFVGAAINVLVFLIVWRVLHEERAEVSTQPDADQSEPRGDESTSTEPENKPRVSKRSRNLRKRKRPQGDRNQHSKPLNAETPGKEKSNDWILWLIACSGAVSFAYEILFTRMLGHFLGGSVFAFASMLASFLLGIAIGGAIAARFANRSDRSAIGFFYAQCGTVFLAMASWYSLEFLAEQINTLATSRSSESIPRVLCAIAILLPPAITIGMTFPWAVRIHARDQRDAAKSAAKVYGFNTIGGVSGAFLTGTYLLPLTNYQLTMAIALVASLIIAIAVFLFAQPRKYHLAAVLAGAVAVVVGFPKEPDNVLRVSSFQNYVRLGQLVYVKAGRSATVTVHNNAGVYSFSTNGLTEAGSRPKGSLVQWDSAPHWLGVLPSMLKPQAKSMLVIGFGGGVAPAHAPSSIKEIDVFELEEGMIEANQLIASERDRDPLSDPRINLILNDGRSGLALTEKKYDVIVSQPSHPWTAGASHLYTLEFAETVRDHLTDDGIFVLWMDSQFADVAIARSLGATLGRVYSQISLYRPNESTLLFVGSQTPIDIDGDAWIPRSNRDRTLAKQLGADLPGELLALRALDDQGLRQLCADAPLTTDNNNLLALRRSHSLRDEKRVQQFNRLVNQFDPLLRPPIKDSWPFSVDRSMIARRRGAMGRPDNATLLSAQIADESERLFAEGYSLHSRSLFQEAAQTLRKSIDAEPKNSSAWILLFVVSHSGRVSDDVKIDYATVKANVQTRYAAVAEAIENLRLKKSANMKSIDQTMSLIPETDPLFALTTMLRIQWRDTDDASGSIRQRGEQNLALIDRLAPFTEIDDLMMYRLKAAAFARRPFIALTTAQTIADLAVKKVREHRRAVAENRTPEPINIDELRVQLINCLKVIDTFQGDPRIPEHRFYGVRLYVQGQLQILSD
ncbi:MAG: fused MFS/spermidine synthase [Pirellulaceae bacterium]|nr:fused MFS/spermidine synthase [Pirellulaceae bacterium]